MPKPTGYGTRPHALTFHIYNPITLLVLDTVYHVLDLESANNMLSRG